ncbi:MAG: hypothetical protein KKF74_02060 [Nanoarchaeota archaeon]|nr:hypothetical protein [Nanoarchaeota archaeon]
MANKEFNKMLDDYVGSIRKKNSIDFSEKFKNFFKSKPKKKIQIDQGTTEEYIDINDERLESDVIEEKKGFLDSFFGKFLKLFSAKPKKTFEEEKIVFEEPEEIETKYEKPVVKEVKDNFVSRLFRKIFCFRKKEYPEEPEKEPELKTYGSEMDEDVVKVLNIVNSLFKKLPQNVKYQFRNSKDFEIYSDILKKYHIIKKD